MRDDFTEEVKRTMAARTGNACSNPDCRALTSGPQGDPTKALNVGVAAHITRAAEGGERYNLTLSSEERRHPDNGIWLCQTCAKLIDNDASRFTEKLLRAWKEIAEDRALGSIGKTVTPVAESESQRKLRAILPWKGKTIKLSHMNTGKAAFMLGPVRGSAFAQVFDCTEFHVRVGKIGNDGWSRSIALADIEICFDEHDRLELQEVTCNVRRQRSRARVSGPGSKLTDCETCHPRRESKTSELTLGIRSFRRAVSLTRR